MNMTALLGIIALAALAAMAAMAMADVAHRGIPGPRDAELLLQDTVTKTADFNSTGLDLGSGFAPGGIGVAMAGVIEVTAADRASSDETYAFTLQESDDNATFVACGVPVSVTVSGATSTIGNYVAKAIVSKRYVRLSLDLGGTTPSVTYKATLNPNV
jgi:hypothetical protein